MAFGIPNDVFNGGFGLSEDVVKIANSIQEAIAREEAEEPSPSNNGITLFQLVDLYDNWRGTLVINDNKLETLVKGEVESVMCQFSDLWDKEVASFGFYDDELCVRLK